MDSAEIPVSPILKMIIMKSLLSSAKKMIAENIYMTIATASKNGRPWISPVYFAYDNKFNFYWSSAKSSLHSRLIKNNNRVAVVVFNSNAKEGTGDGVYMIGKASEVPDKKISHVMNLLSKRTGKTSKYFKDKTPKDYTGNSPVRFYKFIPKKFWILGNPKKVGKFLIDVRRVVKMRNN